MNLTIFIVLLALLFTGLGAHGYYRGDWSGYVSGGCSGVALILLVVLLAQVFR